MLMVLFTLLCVAGPHAHADTPQSAGVSHCGMDNAPHEHEASCDAPAAQPPVTTVPVMSQHERCSPPLGAEPPPTVRPPERAPLLALLCLARM